MLRRLYKSGVGIIVRHTYLLESTSSVLEGHSSCEAKTAFYLGRSCSSVPDKTESSSSSDEESDKNVEGAQLMRSLNAHSFTEYLRSLGKERMHISMDELMQLTRDRGVTASVSESRALCNALVAAGVLFRYRDVVYLDTDEVAETLLTSLPNSEAEFEQRVKELEKELNPLQKQKQTIDSRSSVYSGVVLWGGFWFLIFQFGVFLRLTFWELSWDVIEPVAYFVSLFYGIVVYSYFLLSNENFEYDQFRDRLRSFFSRRMSTKFDQMKYERLTKDLARYRKYLSRYRI